MRLLDGCSHVLDSSMEFLGGLSPDKESRTRCAKLFETEAAVPGYAIMKLLRRHKNVLRRKDNTPCVLGLFEPLLKNRKKLCVSLVEHFRLIKYQDGWFRVVKQSRLHRLHERYQIRSA